MALKVKRKKARARKQRQEGMCEPRRTGTRGQIRNAIAVPERENGRSDIAIMNHPAMTVCHALWSARRTGRIDDIGRIVGRGDFDQSRMAALRE